MTEDHNTVAEASVFFDHDAEAATLAAMMLDPKVVGEVESILSAQAFHKPANGLLFTALTELRAANKPTDPITLGSHLAEKGQLVRVPGGAVYLAELIETLPIAASGTHFARIVADRALLRDLDTALGGVRAAIRAGGSGSPADLVERARLMVVDLAARVEGDGGPTRWRDMIRPGLDAIEQAQESGEGPPGIPTGLDDLDRVIHGLEPGRLIVVAGQPGGGKSTLGSDFFRSAAFDHKTPTGVWTMEMTKLEVFNRAVCAHASVDAAKVANGTMEIEDWTDIAKVCGETEDAPLWIDDTKGLTFADIRVRARKLKQQHDLRLVIVDYLGLIECRGSAPRNQQIDELCRQFKNLAGELGVAVVLLAQLNRNAGQRADKRPILTDLKESGGIEAHSDVVIFVHREEQYDPTKRKGEADLIVAKNRTGPLESIPVAAQLHLNRFYSMALPERTSHV